MRLALLAVGVLLASGGVVPPDRAPVTLQVRVRRAELPTGGGAVTVVLETGNGPLTLSGDLEDALVVRWLLLHGGQSVTLTLSPVPTAEAHR